MRVYALDIGVSAIKRAVVEIGPPCQVVTPMKPLRLPPTPTFHAVQERVLGALSVAGATGDVDLVAIATAGAVEADGLVVSADGIQGYHRIHWPTLLPAHLPELAGRVDVVNGGVAATWAEYHRRGQLGTHVHFALGAGIGGGIVIDGRLVGGSGAGPAGLGHILVHSAGTARCSCTRVGCVETLASARAIRLSYKALQQAESDGDSSRTARTPTLLELTHRARGGDTAARRVFESAGYWLGIAAADLVNILNPDVITVGGGLARAAEIAAGSGKGYLGSAQDAMRSRAIPRLADHARLEPAAYGTDAELIGAALLAASAAAAPLIVP